VVEMALANDKPDVVKGKVQTPEQQKFVSFALKEQHKVFSSEEPPD